MDAALNALAGSSLGFVALSALGLLVLALGPLLAHLARQTPVERQAFGAMMLLRRLVKEQRRRRRLRDIILLLLRMLLVALAVLVVARPELGLTELSTRYGGSGRVVLVLDNSLSMSAATGLGAILDLSSSDVPSGATLFSKAREEALSFLRSLPDGTRVGIVSVASSRLEDIGASRLSPELEADRGHALGWLESIEPSHESTDLTGALRHARILLAGEPGEVFVFTDESGPQTVARAEPELRRLLDAKVRVIPRVSREDPPSNLLPVSAIYGDGIEGGSIRALVSGFRESPTEVALRVRLPDQSEMAAFASLPGCPPVGVGEIPPACEQAEVLFTVPPEVPGGVASVSVQDPVLAQDNLRYFHLPRVGASRVLIVDGDPGPTPIRSEVYFLERALAPWGALRTGITSEVLAPAGLVDRDLSSYRVIFLANVADPRPMASRLSDFVRGGGGLVISAGDNITPERYNGALAPLLPAPIRKLRNLVELSEEGGVPVQTPDTGLELFRPFTSAGRQGFTRMFLRRLVTFDPYAESEEVRTLLKLQNGMPLLIEREVGRGRVLFLAGPVDLAWGNLPVQASFMPFIQRLTSFLGGESGAASARFEGVTGEPLSVPLPDASLSPQVLGPDGNALPTSTIDGRLRFVPRRPGAYSVVIPGAPPLAWIAVNTPIPESDPRLFGTILASEARIDPAQTTRRIALGPWALALAFALMLAQAALAFLGTRSRAREDRASKGDSPIAA